MSLYQRLQNANTPKRLDTAGRLVDGMCGTNTSANRAFLGVCEEVIAAEGALETPGDESLPRWEFPAHNSALLINIHPRVRGFLGAIKRAPQARTIIDAGTGSSALLAVGAAVMHPRAEVTAYEINEPAARCARAVVGLMGLANRIDVQVADVITTPLPKVDLAVTETFASGLLAEKGLEITEALARTAKEILPAYGVLYACDETVSSDTRWQHASTVNFALPNSQLSGRLRSTNGGNRAVYVYAGYYDAREDPILAQPGSNNLTFPVHLGSVTVPGAGANIDFSYAAGSELHQQPAALWTPGAPALAAPHL
ncbi:MAG: methyltransferase [Candidatus Saccharimonadales bacterium]